MVTQWAPVPKHRDTLVVCAHWGFCPDVHSDCLWREHLAHVEEAGPRTWKEQGHSSLLQKQWHVFSHMSHLDICITFHTTNHTHHFQGSDFYQLHTVVQPPPQCSCGTLPTPQKGSVYPAAVDPQQDLQVQASSRLISVSVDLPFLGISYQRTPAGSGLLCLGSFT